MSIQRLELTIRLEDSEVTLTTTECLEGRIWKLLADNYEGEDYSIRRLFEELKHLQEETVVFKRDWKNIEERMYFYESIQGIKQKL